jgi:hypothetical protein
VARAAVARSSVITITPPAPTSSARGSGHQREVFGAGMRAHPIVESVADLLHDRQRARFAAGQTTMPFRSETARYSAYT